MKKFMKAETEIDEEDFRGEAEIIDEDVNEEDVSEEDVNEEDVSEEDDELFPQVTMFNWLIVMFISFIPIVGQLMLVIWAFGSRTNPSLANYAKAALIYTVILIGLVYLYSTILLGVLTRFTNIG